MHARHFFFPGLLTALILTAAEPEFPNLEEIPAELKLAPGSSLTTDRDGNFLVNGKIRTLLGMELTGDLARDLLPGPGYPAELKWLYEQPLSYDSAQRLGFDTLAVYNPPLFLQQYGRIKTPVNAPKNLAMLDQAYRSGLPVYVDFSWFPWTSGLLTGNKKTRPLPAEALNLYRNGENNHWVPYAIHHPQGRAAYLACWKQGAELAKASGAPIVAYELFNEPGYDDFSALNRRLFTEFLQKKYGTAAKMNAVWRTKYPSFEAASGFKFKSEAPGLLVDWTKFMEQSFVGLCAEGRKVIESIDPGARFSVQPLARNSYRALPQSNVNLYALSKVLNAVTTPTGGAASVGGGLSAPAKRTVETPDSAMGEGFLSRHFLRAIADGQPIINSEAYIGNNGRGAVSTAWRDLLSGSNATYLFEWSRRAWDYKPAGSEQGARAIAERYPWMVLNPYAYPVADMTAFMKVKKEIFRFGKFFMPRNRGIPRETALLISFPTERYGAATGNTGRNDIAGCASALEFSHYPADAILEEQLPEGRAMRYKAIVAAGVRNVYPGTAEHLQKFVRSGGTLILLRDWMAEDEYGNPGSGWGDFFTIQSEDDPQASTVELKLTMKQDALLPGPVKGRNVKRITAAPGWEVLGRAGKSPVLLKRAMGKGHVYLLTAAMQDYALAAVLGGILQENHIRPVAAVTRDEECDLAANVELYAAKRDGRTVFFLFNRDRFAKMVRVKSTAEPDAPGFDLLEQSVPPQNGTGTAVLLGPHSYTIIGIGERAAFEPEFGPFHAVTEAELNRREKAVNAEIARRNEKAAQNAFRFHPDPARLRTLDLRKFCNRGFTDRIPGDGKGGWTDQGADQSLTGVPWGVQEFRGVPCEIIRFDENEDRTCIVLSSLSQKGKLPDEVTGIPVNSPVKTLYFFHAAAWAEPGKTALTYRVRYRDGSVAAIPIRCGQEIWDWWVKPGNPYTAWKNLASRGFYIWRWENPAPQKEIASIDLVSARNHVTAAVLGITAESLDPAALPKIRKIDIRTIRVFDTRKKLHPDGTLELVTWEKSKAWAGVQIPLPECTPEEKERAGLRFKIRGGADRFGNPRGGQSLQIHAVQKLGKKTRRLSREDNIKPFLQHEKAIAPDHFTEVFVPLKKLSWKHAPGDANMLILQFTGGGNQSGLILADFRLEIPQKIDPEKNEFQNKIATSSIRKDK